MANSVVDRPVRLRAKKRSERPAWMEKPHPVNVALKGLLIVLIAFLTLYPMLAVLGTSFAGQAEIAQNNGLVLFPLHPSWDAYQTIFSGGVVTSALLRSLLITIIGTAASLAITVAMAYGLTRKDLIGGKFFLTAALFTMLFSAGIIPNFLVVKELGLLNNYASLILPVMISAFNLIVIRSFFQSLPQELLEAARIDGVGDFGILIRIVLPLSKGVLAVIGLFYAVNYWNAFFSAMLYLDADQWPLPMILRQYALLGQPMADGANTAEISAPSQAIQMAVVVISLIPIVLVFPFLQRYFTKGVLTGAVKG